MISVSGETTLQPITAKDDKRLWHLMSSVYPKAYQHLWEDKGDWYLEQIWSKQQLIKELEEKNASYYFVVYDEIDVGVLRYIKESDFADWPNAKTLKLHRLYLDDSVQGKGVGKQLMRWVEDLAKTTSHKAVWLEVMDTQTQALQFYKRNDYKITSDFKLDFQLMYPHLRGMHKMYKILD